MELLPRIKELLLWSGLGPAAFADEIGVGRPIVSHIISGRNKASLEVVQKILLSFLDISPAWLLVGQGPMLKELVSEESQNTSINSGEVKKESLNLIENFRGDEGKMQKEPPREVMGKSQQKQKTKELVKVVLLYSDGTFASYDQ